MCGRFTLTISGERLAEHFGFPELTAAGGRYNIAPGQPIWTLASEDGSPPVPRAFGWGLVPFWAKEAKIGYRMINARAETVAEKPAYRQPYKRRRCLVLADGYYEWRASPAGKQPYFITFDDRRPFAFAGLWDTWKNPADGNDVRSTCTVLTTAATPELAEIHDRMPVVLNDAGADSWLEMGSTDPLPAILARLPTLPLTAWPVSRHVNSPEHEDAACIEPVDLAPGG